MADLQPGWKILDLGCGNAVAALAARARIGSTHGSITAVDISHSRKRYKHDTDSFRTTVDLEHTKVLPNGLFIHQSGLKDWELLESEGRFQRRRARWSGLSVPTWNPLAAGFSCTARKKWYEGLELYEITMRCLVLPRQCEKPKDLDRRDLSLLKGVATPRKTCC